MQDIQNRSQEDTTRRVFGMRKATRHGSSAAICLVALLVTSSSGANAEGLIDPGWEDPFFTAYLQEHSGAVPVAGGAIDFSLPVLGYSTPGAPGPIEVSEADPLGKRLAKRISKWPSCAKDTPNVVTVPDKPEQAAGLQLGTWYATTYDFGCLQVVIEGDRNPPDPELVPVTADVPESGEITITNEDENAGAVIDEEGDAAPLADPEAALGPALVSYTRGNLTYLITVSCESENEAFCADHGDLRVLVEELVPLAGRPKP